MKLGVLGDIHLFSRRVPVRRLLSKRVLGHANLVLNRHKRFEHALLPAMLDRLGSLESELVLMSGDVSTSSLECEFAALRGVLAGLGEAVLVPGNHDRYTFRSGRVKRIETELAGLLPERFPHVRGLGVGDSGVTSGGGWKLVALDSAVPNVVLSRGALGRRQFSEALAVIESAKKGEGLVVLCHYPCVVPAGVASGWTHDLAEAKRLRGALSGCAARVLFVHGHVHRPWYVAGPKGLRKDFEVLNAGSPCLKSGKYPRGQGFWELDLPADPRGEVEAMHHRPTSGDAETGLVWATRRYVNGVEAG